ncbi:MAG: hypothetical protein IPJ88_09340 [Myxococcales bacterium]|nr:MAG: hypothetical protein IPJ88_09340 [Myxococcales bacterium]
MKQRNRTTQGNPHQLSCNQHIVSAAHIRRFANEKGLVSVLQTGSKKVFPAKSDNKVFCTWRSWDHVTEQQFFTKHETTFQQQVDRALKEQSIDHEIISSYSCIWRIRLRFSQEDNHEIPINGVVPDKLTRAAEEILEKKGVGFTRDKAIPSRIFNKGRTILNFDQCMASSKVVKWGVLKAPKGHRFICSDAIVECGVLPATPSLLFVANEISRNVDSGYIRCLNSRICKHAQRFIFCHPDDQEILLGH